MGSWTADPIPRRETPTQFALRQAGKTDRVGVLREKLVDARTRWKQRSSAEIRQPNAAYIIERARSTTSRRLAEELGKLSLGQPFTRTLGWTRDELTQQKFISGVPDDRYRNAISHAAAVLRPLAARLKVTFSTLVFTCSTTPEETAVQAPGRCLLWTWSSRGKATAKTGASRWYETHGHVQSVRVDGNLKHRFEGALYSVIGYCWDDDLHNDVVAIAALKRDGFLTEMTAGSDASETTDPESEDDEDFLGLNRGRGCPLFPPPRDTDITDATSAGTPKKLR